MSTAATQPTRHPTSAKMPSFDALLANYLRDRVGGNIKRQIGGLGKLVPAHSNTIFPTTRRCSPASSGRVPLARNPGLLKYICLAPLPLNNSLRE